MPNTANDPRTVLVADDEESIRLYLATVLRREGYNVIEAPDGKRAAEEMQKRDNTLTAIISDIRMPGMDGLQLAEFNFENSFLPFIACTMIADASMALKFLKFGVHDYVVKPVEEPLLLAAVRNAIERRRLPRLFADDETPLPGNLGIITISARVSEIHRARAWLELKSAIMPPAEQKRFLAFASEFLMNAYEHGSLRLTEAEKSAHLDAGTYQEELRKREKECRAKIEVALSIVGNEVAVNITDNGFGFNYRRYQNMPEEELLDRLTKPNGRGIQMAMQYFDSITFAKGGSSVLLTKKIASAAAGA